MFSWFKRKKKIVFPIELFKCILKRLPKEYDFLSKQVEEGVILAVRKEEEWYKPRLEVKLFNKYLDNKGRYYELNNIIVENVSLNARVVITIEILSSTLHRYKFSDDTVLSWNNNGVKIDVDTMKVRYLDTQVVELGKQYLTEEEMALVCISELYEIELEGKTYLHIAELCDGDFMGVDKDRNIYCIYHDPYEIELIEEPIIDVLRRYDNL